MRNLRISICIGIALVFLAATLLAGVQVASASKAPEYAPGRVTVGVEKINAKFYEAISARGGVVIQEIPQINVLVVQVAIGKELEFIQNIKTVAGVKYAQQDGIVRATYVPNDPYWANLWGMQKINADNAWDIERGDLGIILAIADTGVDYNHNDLAAHYLPGGRDWANNDDDPRDDNGHGTHVSGTAAAIMDNGIGVVGVAQVTIFAEKVLTGGGWGYWSWLASGIAHATDSGVDIISMSLGGYGYDASVDAAVEYAWANGVLLVAAAGNDNLNIDLNPFIPAGFPEVIAVSATDQNDNKAWFSNYGNKIEVAAPGVSIFSTWPNNQYASLSGTSMSTPHVSGLAALMWSLDPSMTNIQLRDRLHTAVDDIGSPGKDQYFGYGRINAFKGVIAQPIVIEHTYTFSIGPGGSWSTTSILSDDMAGPLGTGYVDKFVMTVTATTKVHLELSAQATGDTIALLRNAEQYWYATAPGMLILEGTVGSGTYMLYVGYFSATVTPATYDFSVTGS